ncbi:hypothetical protein DL96DRAFT_1469462, partial [Flagelloscypha sp. PMI_526]
IETIKPAHFRPARQHIPRLHFKISETREVSIQAERENDAEVKIATDGSGYEGGIGGAAILKRRGRNALKSLKLHLGPDTQHTVFNGEEVGMGLGLHLLMKEEGMDGKNVLFYIDSQALVQALETKRTKSGQWYLRSITNRLRDWLSKHRASTITIYWISAHSEVELNELADEAAKEAAQGRGSSQRELPGFLRGVLPAAISAIKQKHAQELKQEWKVKWTNSDRYKRMTAIDTDFPYHKFFERASKLSRRRASLLFQIRINHVPLNQYLFRFKKREDGWCPHCTRRAETFRHLLIECQAYRRERSILRRETGRHAGSLKDLLLKEKMIDSLVRFLILTNRFDHI